MSYEAIASTLGQVVQSSRQIAHEAIRVTRTGGSRGVNAVDQRLGQLIENRTRLSEKLRQDLVASQQEVTRYWADGIDLAANVAESAVDTVAGVANTRVANLPETLVRIGQLGQRVIASLPVVAMPMAQVYSDVANSVAQRVSAAATRLVEGRQADDEVAGELVAAEDGSEAPARRRATRRKAA